MTDAAAPPVRRPPDMEKSSRPHVRCLLTDADGGPAPFVPPVPAPRAAVIYSSVTGNTRRLAEALTLGHLPLFSVTRQPDTTAYDLLALGFWVRKGLPDARAQRCWAGIRAKHIFLFGTLGAWPHSPHASRCLKGARALLTANGNRVVGEFLCQGRVSPHVLAASSRKGTHPMTEGRAARLAEAARHPDAGDIAAACACWRAVLAALAPQAVPPALPPLPSRTEHSLMKGQLRYDPAWLDAFFQRADEIFVSFSGGEFPYVLPLNFVWLEGRLYLHCGFTGRKLDLLRQDDRVGFAAALDVTIVREQSTTWYKSVSGCGRIRLVTDTDEKRRALDALSLRYAARCPRPAPDAMLRRVNVLCIEVAEISGKEREPR